MATPNFVVANALSFIRCILPVFLSGLKDALVRMDIEKEVVRPTKTAYLNDVSEEDLVVEGICS